MLIVKSDQRKAAPPTSTAPAPRRAVPRLWDLPDPSHRRSLAALDVINRPPGRYRPWGGSRYESVWRHSVPGRCGRSVATEGYIRTVADRDWEVKGTADYDGDGMADILWRHRITGQNYLYPMNGTAILQMEGYLRTVADINWKPRTSVAWARPYLVLPGE